MYNKLKYNIYTSSILIDYLIMISIYACLYVCMWYEEYFEHIMGLHHQVNLFVWGTKIRREYRSLWKVENVSNNNNDTLQHILLIELNIRNPIDVWLL